MHRSHLSRPVQQALALVLAFASSWASAQTPPADPFNYTRTSAFTYGANGLLETEVVEPDSITQCVVTTHGYDAYGNKSTVTTANCAAPVAPAANAKFDTRQALTSFDAAANGAYPAGMFATKTQVALTASLADAATQIEQRVYEPRFGTPTSLTGPNGLTTSWTYDAFGRKDTETWADATKTVYAYCILPGRGIDTSSNSARCQEASIASREANEVPSDAVRYEHAEPRGKQNAQALVDTKIGPFSRVYFDRAGRKLRTVTQAFDGANQVGGTARLIVQDTEYNAQGAVVLTTQPYFLDTGSSLAAGNAPYGMQLTEFDALGRPVRLFVADSQGSVTTGKAFNARGMRVAARTEMAYEGLTTTTTDDKGNTRREEKNPDGKVVRVTDALGAQIVHQHDAFGNLIETKDPLNNRIVVRYDVRGRKISLSDPDAGVTAYCYDALGQLKLQQTSNQRGSHALPSCPGADTGGSTAPSVAGWTSFGHDRLGRMTERREPEYNTFWTYDKYADGTTCNKGVGKLCEVRTSHGLTRRHAYDSLGRPVGTRVDHAGGPSMATGLSYDWQGRVSSQTYPTGVVLNYGYTAGSNGFLERVTLGTTVTGVAGASSGAVLWQAMSVNAWGKSEQQRNANGGVTQAGDFDALTGRVQRLYAGPMNGTSVNPWVMDHEFQWNSLGLMTLRKDKIGDNTGIQVHDTFKHDALGRLTEYEVTGGSAGTANTRKVVITYNALGMLLYKTDVGSYAYPAQGVANGRPHAVQSISGTLNASFTAYDLNGNLTAASGMRYASIAYTSFNLPDSQNGIQGPAGTPKYTWVYGEDHQRVRETRVNSQGTRTTYFFHPDNQGGLGFEYEVAPNGVASARHYVQAGSGAVLVTVGALPAMAAGALQPPVLNANPLSSGTGGRLEYWFKDHLGSIVAVTAHDGTVVARYAYDPYGKRRYTRGTYDAFGALVVDWVTVGGAGSTDRGFTGHEHLDDVGLVHMNGRIFDPTIGRFLQADPIIQDRYNLLNYDRYGYCYNSPLGCIDPSGFSFWTKVRDLVVRVVAAWLDLNGCLGYCSKAVAVYQGYKSGGGPGAFIAFVTVQSGIDAQSAPAIRGFAAAAAGCAAAVHAGGRCEQGAANGLAGYGLQELSQSLQTALGDIWGSPGPGGTPPFVLNVMEPSTDGGDYVGDQIRLNDIKEATRQRVEITGTRIAKEIMGASALEDAWSEWNQGQKWLAAVHAASALPYGRPVRAFRYGSAAKGPIHHICTNKNCVSAVTGGPWTPRFEAMFNKAGMKLDDALNKIAVPGHKGPHPEAYHQAVFDRLTSATNGLSGSAYSNALQTELRVIGREIQTPGSLLNGLVTKP